jgi:hypothetical protein
MRSRTVLAISSATALSGYLVGRLRHRVLPALNRPSAQVLSVSGSRPVLALPAAVSSAANGSGSQVAGPDLAGALLAAPVSATVMGATALADAPGAADTGRGAADRLSRAPNGRYSADRPAPASGWAGSPADPAPQRPAPDPDPPAARAGERSRWRGRRQASEQRGEQPGQPEAGPAGRALPWRGPAALLAVVVLLGVLALVSLRAGHPLPVGIGALAALAVCAFVLRGPRPHARPAVLLTGLPLLTLLATVIVGQAVVSLLDSINPKNLLELTLLGICAVGIVLALIVTWLPGWDFAESIAVGVVALALGALCLPGLAAVTKSLQYPATSGQALLFASGARSQPLRLNLAADPQTGPPYHEVLSVLDLGRRPVHWALLLTGDARLRPVGPTLGVQERELSPSGSGGYAQLFSGTAVPLGGSPLIHADALTPLAKRTSDRWAVSFPAYELGQTTDLTPAQQQAVSTALGGRPVTRTLKHFTVAISAMTGQFETVDAAYPAATRNPAYPQSLSWTSHTALSPQYTATDEDATKLTTNILFVFAILLGVAGAGVLSSLQSVIRVLADRTKARAPR